MGLTRITSDGITDGTITGTDLATNIDLVDNQLLRLGTGNDLVIKHDGSNSYIQDLGTGQLFIASSGGGVTIRANSGEASMVANTDGSVELYHDNVKTFFTTASGIQVQGTSGGAGQIVLSADANEDNADKFKLVVEDNGPLKIQNRASGSWETNIECNGNGNVELYHNNSKKLETTSSGATVTGALTVDNAGGNAILGQNLSLVDNGMVKCGNNDDLQISHDGTDSIINNFTGSLKFQRSGSTKILFDTNGDLGFVDSRKAYFGDGADLKIYHDGTDSHVNNYTGTFYIQAANNLVLQNTSGDKYFIGREDAATELYHDNSKKLETRSNGITVTGYTYSDGVTIGNGTSYKYLAGDSHQLQMYHTGSGGNGYLTNSTGTLHLGGGTVGFTNAAVNAFLIRAISGGAAELYHNGSKKFETASHGITSLGDVYFDNQVNAGKDVYWDESNDRMSWSDNVHATFGNGEDLRIYHDGSNTYIKNITNNLHIGAFSVGSNSGIAFYSNNAIQMYLNPDGDLVPDANNNHDLGSNSLRWRNIYTNDLNLSNEGGSNDVDGTWGSYTIQEGAEDLFLVNKRNGKKYKFNLTEVS